MEKVRCQFQTVFLQIIIALSIVRRSIKCVETKSMIDIHIIFKCTDSPTCMLSLFIFGFGVNINYNSPNNTKSLERRERQLERESKMDPRSFSVICAACHISIGHVVWAHRIWRISSILLLLKLPCHKKKCGQKQIEHRSKHRHAHKKAVAAAIKWENLSLKYCVSTVDRQVKRSITTGGVILIYWLSSSPQKKKYSGK